mgnify:CR=1 FL=1
MKKSLLAIALMLSLGTIASSQVQDVSLIIASVPNGSTTAILSEARLLVFRGDPRGIVDTNPLNWALEHCDASSDWHPHSFTITNPSRITFSIAADGLYRVLVSDPTLGLVTTTYFCHGALP